MHPTAANDQPTNNMKIRLETTHSEPKYSHAVEITVQQDVPALLGFGFQQETIDQINQP
jgi:hypothetical protein